MDFFLRDLRYSFRMLVKNPGFSAAVIFVLTLGLGASSALFSIVDGVLMHPFPYKDSERAVVLRENFPRRNSNSFVVSVPEYLDLRGQTGIFEDVAAIRPTSLTLTNADNPERVAAAWVTANVFSMTGVQAVLGRTFTDEEDKPGGDKVAVLSHRFWERKFFSDQNIAGKTIKLNDETYTVIGVMPNRYRIWGADVWLPLGLNTAETDRTRRSLWALAWLKPGLNPERAQAQLAGVSRQIEDQYVSTVPEYAGFQITVNSLGEGVIRDLKPALYVLLGAVGFVLLIACANVGNLLLSRAKQREQEISIRMALGASRGRIVSQLLTESLYLAVPSGILGFFLNLWCLGLLVSLIPPSYITEEAEIRASSSTLIFTLGVSIFMALLFGLFPTLHLTRSNIADAIRESGRRVTGGMRGRYARTTLVVLEVSLAFVVLIGAGLMIRSYMRMTDLDLGFRTENVLTMRIALPESKYREPHQVTDFYRDLLRRIDSQPGIVASTAVSSRPLGDRGETQDFSIEGRPLEDVGGMSNADFRIVNHNYFELMGIPLKEGRLFAEQDGPDALQVAIINETMARNFWPDGNVIGSHIRLRQANRNNTPAPEAPWLTVVGVVNDSKQRSDLSAQIRPEICVPLLQRGVQARNMALAVRTSGEPSSATSTIRSQVLSLDSQQPIYEVLTMPEIVVRALGPKRLAMMLLSLFAGLAMVLAAVGLYAITAHAVTQRTREIGIRMALGAQPGDVLKLILRQGIILTLIGLAIGLGAALTLTRLMSSLLYGVSATDPVTVAAISLFLVFVAVVANYIPAHRATKIDPSIVLRYE